MQPRSDAPSPESVQSIRARALEALGSIRGETDAEQFRITYLGKKGLIRGLLKGLGGLPEDKRRETGAAANQLRRELEEKFAELLRRQKESGPEQSSFDPTLPGFPFPRGSLHPLLKIRDRMCKILQDMGFDVAYGPDVESDYYNFGALNFPPDHPARDMQDTFVVSPEVVLRTHTSPVQIRVMENQKPPIRCIMPGRVYRHEEVSARSYCVFHQVEGLFIDTRVSFADLKGTLLEYARRFFDDTARVKFRPSFFPFTEPSVEMDVECFLCGSRGCSVCKQTGWLEVLGAGMVHPNVLRNGGLDPETYSGFAFGMGIDRTALLKYGIDDIRLFFENDVRFLRQF